MTIYQDDGHAVRPRSSSSGSGIGTCAQARAGAGVGEAGGPHVVSPGSAAAIAAELISRSHALEAELQAFSDLLDRQRGGSGSIPGLSRFGQLVANERRFTEGMLAKSKASVGAQIQQQDLSREQGSSSLDEDGTATEKKLRHQLSSTNLPFFETVWDSVKRCRGLASMAQKFNFVKSAGVTMAPSSSDAITERSSGGRKGQREKKNPNQTNKDNASDLEKGRVLVDAVVDNGAEWLRICNISEKRLLLQMTAGGWDFDDVDETDSCQDGDGGIDLDDESEIDIVRIAHQLVAASRLSRHDYRHPRIHLVLPRLERGHLAHIDRLLSQIQRMSDLSPVGSVPVPVPIRVSCGTRDAFLSSPAPPLSAALPVLLIDPLAGLTDAVNIDCTLLVALASDISHSHTAPQDWHSDNVRGQIRDELDHSHTLVRALYPALVSRQLLCTRAAAARFWEIVDTLATDSERRRAEILVARPGNLDNGSDSTPITNISSLSSTPSAQVEEANQQNPTSLFQALSIHPVPPTLRLPIQVIDGPDQIANPPESGTGMTVRAAVDRALLPRVALRVAPPALSPLNAAVFLTGWARGLATLTSNKTVAHQIEHLVESGRTPDVDDEVGPVVWVCSVTRSLAAKEKPRDLLDGDGC